MTLVTNSNFDPMFSKIESLLQNSCFVAIDTEFTGLFTKNETRASLFDTPEIRYKKLKQAAEKFVICQFGLVPFVWESDENRYVGHRFLFYICPRSCFTINPLFAFQSSAMEFLCLHNFDFNKFAYEGISYLNKDDEQKLRDGALKEFGFSSYWDVDQELLQRKLSAVSAWLIKAVEGETTTLDKEGFTNCQSYLFLDELHHRFPLIWATYDNNKILIRKVSPQKRKQLEHQSDNVKEQLLNSIVGFSRLFQALADSKKPIVGHNLLMDLILMYHHFHRSLPASFHRFKTELHKLFPVVYDTKYIFQQNRKLLENAACYCSGSLGDLYSFLKSPEGQYIALFYPSIRDILDNDKKENCFHEAGYDAFVAGYIFVRLMHIVATLQRNISEARRLSWKELEKASLPYRNRVNIIRARCHHINLSGHDPPCARPQWLHIGTRNGKCLEYLELTELCSRYGNVDVKMLNNHEAIVAVGNYLCRAEIVGAIVNHHKDLKVSTYNVFKHSRPVRVLLWTVLFLSSGFTGYFLLKSLRRG